jgi:hypothetical protein
MSRIGQMKIAFQSSTVGKALKSFSRAIKDAFSPPSKTTRGKRALGDKGIAAKNKYSGVKVTGGKKFAQFEGAGREVLGMQKQTVMNQTLGGMVRGEGKVGGWLQAKFGEN